MDFSRPDLDIAGLVLPEVAAIGDFHSGQVAGRVVPDIYLHALAQLIDDPLVRYAVNSFSPYRSNYARRCRLLALLVALLSRL